MVVVEAVVDDLLNNALFEVDIPQFVLMGMSAGMGEIKNDLNL